MCVRSNRRSRRVSNYRTKVWVNQYNNIKYNYGTVMCVTNDNDEFEHKENSSGIAIQVINVQQDEQPSTLGHEFDQESGKDVKTSNTSVIRYLAIGVVIGVVCNGIYSLIKNNK